MAKKSFDAEKELQKLQKYLGSLKVGISVIIGICILTIGIILTYSVVKLANKNSTEEQKIKISLVVNNGYTAKAEVQANYNALTSIVIEPNNGYVYDNLSCTNNQKASFESGQNHLTIRATKNTECTINFKLNELSLSTKISSEPIATENKGLYVTTDDLGESLYYKGNVDNNYVSFANILWRIVRINGDQTIRLITNEKVGQSPYSITDSNSADSIQNYLNDFYINNLQDYERYLEAGLFCNNLSENSSESLNCSSTNVNLKIGLMTKDEVELSKLNNQETYLDMAKTWWTMSTKSIDSVYTNSGADYKIGSNLDVYPVINLKKDTPLIAGKGTINNPYKIN